MQIEHLGVIRAIRRVVQEHRDERRGLIHRNCDCRCSETEESKASGEHVELGEAHFGGIER